MTFKNGSDRKTIVTRKTWHALTKYRALRAMMEGTTTAPRDWRLSG